MIPVTWPEIANMHPFAPADQTVGYMEMIKDLSADLCDITGFAAMSMQPNVRCRRLGVCLRGRPGCHRRVWCW